MVPFISEPSSLVLFLLFSILEVMFNEKKKSASAFGFAGAVRFRGVLFLRFQEISASRSDQSRWSWWSGIAGWVTTLKEGDGCKISVGVSPKKMLIDCFCVLNESLRDGGEEILETLSFTHFWGRASAESLLYPLDNCNITSWVKETESPTWGLRRRPGPYVMCGVQLV